MDFLSASPIYSVICINILCILFIILKVNSVKAIQHCTSCNDNINTEPLQDIIHNMYPGYKQYYWLGDFM